MRSLSRPSLLSSTSNRQRVALCRRVMSRHFDRACQISVDMTRLDEQTRFAAVNHDRVVHTSLFQCRMQSYPSERIRSRRLPGGICRPARNLSDQLIQRER